jgi:hypothetical protein
MEIEILKGKTLKKIEQKTKYGGDELVFETIDGNKYKLFHDQDGCESVYIEDICGDLDNLIGEPLLIAEERSNGDANSELEKCETSFTWTFYELATIKGSVTIRWFGCSNGYYSEEVYFKQIL